MKKYYSAGGSRVAMRIGSGERYYLLGDHLGGTNVTVTTAGGEFGEVRYKAFGETRYTSGTTPTTYRYTGQREEQSLGIYYYGARWYDRSLGRFVQPDTIVPGGVQGFDRYSYVGNSPLNFVDPSGHMRVCSGDGGYDPTCGWGAHGIPIPPPQHELHNHGVFFQPIKSMKPGAYYFDTGGDYPHPGQDYPAPEGSPVYAPADGIVILVDICSAADCVSKNRDDYSSSALFNEGYGNVIVIEYPYSVLPAELIETLRLQPGQSLFVLTAHLHEPSTLYPGVTVRAGQVIGQVGSTGFSTGPHLHLEVRVGDTGSLSSGYMCDSICFFDKGVGNYGAKFSVWYQSPTIYSPIDPLNISYTTNYNYDTSYIYK